MKELNIINWFNLFVISCFIASCGGVNNDTLPRIDEVDRLIEEMTLEEKVGQLIQIPFALVTNEDTTHSFDKPLSLSVDSVRKALVEFHIGSVLNTVDNSAQTINKWEEIVHQIQEVVKQETRLKVPVVCGADAVNGAPCTVGSTMFPKPIGQAATWNKQLVYDAAKVRAYEHKASSASWNYISGFNLGIDPLSANYEESFGEDPYLCAVLGNEVVKGYQGDNVSGSTNIATCLKHVLDYTQPYIKHDSSSVTPEQYSVSLFKNVLESGAKSVQINLEMLGVDPMRSKYGVVNELPKRRFGFSGVVVADWLDIDETLKRNNSALSHKELIKLLVNAGVDLFKVSDGYTHFCSHIIELVNEREVAIDRIDNAVRRVLNLKYDMGLFDAVNGNYHNYPKFGSKAFERVAYCTASESIILLKNKGNILPLEMGQKVLVTGLNIDGTPSLDAELLNSKQDMNAENKAGYYDAVYEAFSDEFGDSNVQCLPSVAYNRDEKCRKDLLSDCKDLIRAAQQADVIVLCVDENYTSENSQNLFDPLVFKKQQQLAMELSQTGKPIILLLNDGNPYIISEFTDNVDVVIQSYMPDNFGWDVIADVLSGDVNPSGRLPYTYPRFKPMYQNNSSKGSWSAQDITYPDPLFKFGYGLSYTTFEYSDLKISAKECCADDVITIHVKVKNTGNKNGKEVVQLYCKARPSGHSSSVNQLRAFTKIELFPGEEKEVCFKLLASELAGITRDEEMRLIGKDYELAINNLKTTISLLDIN